jgi:hypothetical protein
MGERGPRGFEAGDRGAALALGVHRLSRTRSARELGFTGEIDNITGEKAYDFFGVERPGRAFYFKTTVEH